MGRARHLCCLAFGVVLGCNGTISDPGITASGTRPGGGGVGAVSCEQREPGRAPLRRLTRTELDNTLRDLLGDDSAPAARRMVAEHVGGFSTNADARSVDALVAEQYLSVAEDVARRATTDLPALMGCDPAAEGESCARAFLESFGARAFRRPVLNEEVERYLAVFRNADGRWGTRVAVELLLQVLLLSPHFLYRVELAAPDVAIGEVERLDGHQLATRLSYTLWSTMPDDVLFAAADAGELDTDEGVATHARRMLADPRAEQTVLRFFEEWLQLEELDTLDKDASVYPEFHDGLRDLFRRETHEFVAEVLFRGDGRWQTLLRADWTMMNAELASFYGVPGPTGEGFERVQLDGAYHAGLLTHASFTATRARSYESSPIHRGMFIRAGLLCGTVPPPPPDIMIEAPDPDPSLTTRERLAEHRENPVCGNCHRLMDPIGFAFEHFDGVGRHRDRENGLPIDATGELVDTDVDGTFDGAPELARRMTESAQVEGCISRQWFRYAQGRSEAEEVDVCSMEQLAAAVRAADGDIDELIVALTQMDAFLYKRVPDPDAAEVTP